MNLIMRTLKKELRSMKYIKLDNLLTIRGSSDVNPVVFEGSQSVEIVILEDKKQNFEAANQIEGKNEDQPEGGQN